jgi:hypothetical protein
MCDHQDLIMFSLGPRQNRSWPSVPISMRLQISVCGGGQVTVIESEDKTLLLRLKVTSGK